MLHPVNATRTTWVALLAAVLVLSTLAPAGAQTLSGISAVKNGGNSADNFQDEVITSFQRKTTVGVIQNVPGSYFRVRYAEAVGVDAGFGSSGTTNTQNSDYTVNFQATTPGAYDLQITTSLNGAFTLVDDGNVSGTADATGVTATTTGGTLVGSLNLSDPGSLSGNGGGNTPFLRTSSATIRGTSNGSPQAHTLRFTWSASCFSNGSAFENGDECAVRLGLPIDYSGETAGDYPGVGGRNQNNDGHFVTVKLVSLCGNETVDSSRGEDCDLGELNGDDGSCCTSTCQFRTAGQVCRASAGVCDLQETCSGSSATCPTNLKSTAPCRTSAGVCDIAESCNGVSNDCPANAFLPSSTVCRAATGTGCDVAENCTGSAAACPADAKRPSGFTCRNAVGVCDVAETCNGTSNNCPADGLASSSTVCRPSSGSCDVAESCTGSSPVCPANVVQPSTTVCRAAAGDCDQAELCDGNGPSCPPDVFLGSTSGSFVCRPAAGLCDQPDLCDGTGPNCPPDVKKPFGSTCRNAVGDCDVAEGCNGTSNTCPPDAFKSSATVCRAASGVCDVAEHCTGSSAACPANGFASSATVCRGAAGVCDQVETCSGSGANCPSDAKSTAVCRPAAGTCDVPEFCSGASNDCPAVDNLRPNGFTCRGSAGSCDVAETCSGLDPNCPSDTVLPSSTQCRASAGACDVAEFCTGTSGVCPADDGGDDGDGDGQCDAVDVCPDVPDPLQADADNDGEGDECDPCTNIVPTTSIKSQLSLLKLLTAPGDDKLKFKGSFAAMPETPTINPVANGARIVVEDASGARPVDAELPGGAYNATTRAGWKVNGSGTTWTYQNSGTVVPLIDGIYKAGLKRIPKTPGLYKFSITGKNGSYAVPPGNIPVKGILVIDTPVAKTGQCGEARFQGPAPFPLCTFVSGGNTLKCK